MLWFLIHSNTHSIALTTSETATSSSASTPAKFKRRKIPLIPIQCTAAQHSSLLDDSITTTATDDEKEDDDDDDDNASPDMHIKEKSGGGDGLLLL